MLNIVFTRGRVHVLAILKHSNCASFNTGAFICHLFIYIVYAMQK